MSARNRNALVLGIGNILWADEGFGPRAAEAFASAHGAGPDVIVMDGGTQGLALVGDVADASHVIVFDAVDWGAEPGTLVVVTGDEVPAFVAAGKMSLHQAGFEDVLACVKLVAHRPREIVLIGVQPEELEDYGGSLRPLVRARVPQAVAIAAAQLRAWGFEVTDTRTQTPDGFIPAISIDPYEQGRPSAQEACRIGDERVLAWAAGE